MRSAKVFFKDAFAGTLRETKSGYKFAYDKNYLRADAAEPVSLTLPLRAEPYTKKNGVPFSENRNVLFCKYVICGGGRRRIPMPTSPTSLRMSTVRGLTARNMPT